MNKSMKGPYNLVNIIFYDLLTYGRWNLILLSLILMTALCVVCITYKTRCVIMYREQLYLEKNKLDSEWNYLMLQEKMLSNHDRVEHIAINKLKMNYIDL